MLKTYYHPGFSAPLGDHIMPIGKFALVAQALSQPPMSEWVELLTPSPVTQQELLSVHSEDYIEAIRTGEPRALAESQKFPWSAELYPSVTLTSGGALAAARSALSDGSSAALVSGFHHANQMRGEGFCTFNGLIVALDALKKQGAFKRAAILDMDLHYGNGTSLLARTREWLFALSIYGNDYWDNVAYRDVSVLKHQDGLNHQSVSLPEGCNRATLLEIMDAHLPKLLMGGKPDLLFYQAGADPYYEDPYSPLALDHRDLMERDELVFKFAKKHSIPIAWVLAGGYTNDISKVVKVHVNTFKAWSSVYQ